MKKSISLLICCVMALAACTHKPSKAELRRAEKHKQDSISLIEQQRSLAYYQSQLDSLMPVADSLVALFKYEKNEKYEDHGFYVSSGRSGVRVKVRDDGKQPVLIYKEGKRINSGNDPVIEKAQHLLIVISDINELEKRIERTSLEVRKYEKRLAKQ